MKIVVSLKQNKKSNMSTKKLLWLLFDLMWPLSFLKDVQDSNIKKPYVGAQRLLLTYYSQCRKKTYVCAECMHWLLQSVWRQIKVQNCCFDSCHYDYYNSPLSGMMMLITAACMGVVTVAIINQSHSGNGIDKNSLISLVFFRVLPPLTQMEAFPLI